MSAFPSGGFTSPQELSFGLSSNALHQEIFNFFNAIKLIAYYPRIHCDSRLNNRKNQCCKALFSIKGTCICPPGLFGYLLARNSHAKTDQLDNYEV